MFHSPLLREQRTAQRGGKHQAAKDTQIYDANSNAALKSSSQVKFHYMLIVVWLVLPDLKAVCAAGTAGWSKAILKINNLLFNFL